jgi:hypothetical protein
MNTAAPGGYHGVNINKITDQADYQSGSGISSDCNGPFSWLKTGAVYDDLLGAYESPDLVVFRDAMEILCQRLVASTDNVTETDNSNEINKNDNKTSTSFQHEQPCWVALPSTVDKHFRSIAHSLAEEFGLRTHSCILDEHTNLKSLHIYSPLDCHIPPLVSAELEAEAVLDREAELQRIREEEEFIEAAKRINATNQPKKKNAKLDLTQIEAKKVEPLFAVRDKRSIGEIQDELLAAKRQKVR